MADTSVFTRLKRLFSTDVVIRNQGGSQLKVVDTDHIQTSGEFQTNSLVDRFGKIYTNPAATSLLGQQFNLQYQYLRTFLYSDYDTMDTDAIVASALDIIADECTLKNDMGEVLQIRSSDEDIQKILYNLFYDILNIEFNLWSWTRQMCKYGDFFLKLEIAEKFGVYNVIPYTAYHIQRRENFDMKNPARVEFLYSPDGYYTGGSGYYSTPNTKPTENQIAFDNYEMAHFRLITDVNYLPYGRSYLEPARRLYKQYVLMEDAMLIHRIARAPEKRIFYINVGNIPPQEVDAFMQKTINTMKKTPLMDEQTGEYNLKYNMQNLLEDFYIPVRGNDQTTKIDTTKGLEYNGIEDVAYLRDKLFAALKVPKAFMGYEKDLTGKATLAAEDIRFARTIDRIQRILLSELYKIALVHLYTQGYDSESLTNFELTLTTPSIIAEQEKINLLKEKVALAKDMLDTKIIPSDWIYDNVFKFSQDQYDEYRDLTIEDAKRSFRIQQITEEGNDPVETGRSYGTPHDLAALYDRNRLQGGSVPDGYDENSELGRPKERASNINTQQNALGRDRLGRQDNKRDDQEGYGTPAYKGGSPLALESKNRAVLESLSKEIVYSKNKLAESLLHEHNLEKYENLPHEALLEEIKRDKQKLALLESLAPTPQPEVKEKPKRGRKKKSHLKVVHTQPLTEEVVPTPTKVTLEPIVVEPTPVVEPEVPSPAEALLDESILEKYGEVTLRDPEALLNESNIEKYGEVIKPKPSPAEALLSESHIEKYGEVIIKNPEALLEETNIEKYGDITPRNPEALLEEINVEKYGDITPRNPEALLEEINIEKYGEIVIPKPSPAEALLSESILEKYGEVTSINPEALLSESNIEKYEDKEDNKEDTSESLTE